MCCLLAHVAFLGGFVVGPVVAERSIAVEGHLRIECVDLTGGLEDQRVDLDQVGVALGVGPVELQQDVDRAIGGVGVQLGRLDPLACNGLRQPVDGVDPDLGDRVGIGLGHRFDLHATLG